MSRWSWLLVLPLLVGACDDAPGHAATRPTSIAVTTMQLTPEDGPFSPEDLLQIAYRYHPQLEHMDIYHNEALFDRVYWATPEWRALDQALERGRAGRSRWKKLIAALDRALPDHEVRDGTKSYLPIPAYVLVIAPRDQGPYPEHRLVAMVSMLVPMTYLYEPVDRLETESLPPLRKEPSCEQTRTLARVFEREVAVHYPGYQRMSVATGATPVPGILVGSLWYGDAILAHALFDNADWW